MLKEILKKSFVICFILVNLLHARPEWDNDPDYRTYRGYAYVHVTDENGNGKSGIKVYLKMEMTFDTDGDGAVGDPQDLEYRSKSTSKFTDQNGYTYLYVDITVPSYWYNGWKHIRTWLSGSCITVLSTSGTFSNSSFWIYPNYNIIPDDCDRDDISDNIENQIAEKFKPVLHRHPNDRQINLENIETLMYNSGTLKGWNYAGYTVYNSDIPPLHIVDYNEAGWIFKNSYGWGSEMPAYELWRIDFNINKSTSYSGAAVGNRPLYYHIFKHESNYYVQYWYFFTMNDIQGDTENDTWHEGDWEHVTIKLNNELNHVAVNFYQHYGGHTKFPAQCWWSSSNSASSIPSQGYSESRTHLHIWISKNGHASYNKNDLVYRMQVNIIGLESDDFQDQCDYETNQSHFKYDFLEKLGEIEYSDVWLGYSPKGNSKFWLPFIGNVGEYWRHGSGFATTPSPRMPAFRIGYYSFTINSSITGFGNGDASSSINIFPPIVYDINGNTYVTAYPLYFYEADISWVQNNSGI